MQTGMSETDLISKQDVFFEKNVLPEFDGRISVSVRKFRAKVYNVEWKFYAAKINRFVLLSNIFLFIN